MHGEHTQRLASARHRGVRPFPAPEPAAHRKGGEVSVACVFKPLAHAMPVARCPRFASGALPARRNGPRRWARGNLDAPALGVEDALRGSGVFHFLKRDDVGAERIDALSERGVVVVRSPDAPLVISVARCSRFRSSRCYFGPPRPVRAFRSARSLRASNASGRSGSKGLRMASWHLARAMSSLMRGWVHRSVQFQAAADGLGTSGGQDSPDARSGCRGSAIGLPYSRRHTSICPKSFKADL